MNIFVLCTGRCGSTTFTKACQHADNFSASHESRGGYINGRLDYPENHIEVDNRLAWFLGRLDKKYGNNAFYFHLKRDLESTARSFANPGLYEGPGKLRAYRTGLIRPELRSDDDVEPTKFEEAIHMCRTVRSNIDLFLKDKTDCMEVQLETAKSDFQEFWDRIGAVGNLSEALAEWNRQYNASDPEADPEADSYVAPPLHIRATKKAWRVARKFPDFLREA